MTNREKFLRNPGKYKSVSAFAPISNPINCPWGQKAFKGYFGEDDAAQQKWKEHDATELVKKWKGPLDVLIDVVSLLAQSFFSRQGLKIGLSMDIGNGRQFLQTGPITTRKLRKGS